MVMFDRLITVRTKIQPETYKKELSFSNHQQTVIVGLLYQCQIYYFVTQIMAQKEQNKEHNNCNIVPETVKKPAMVWVFGSNSHQNLMHNLKSNTKIEFILFE